MHLPVAVAGWSSVGLGVGATTTGVEAGVGDWVGDIDVTVGAGVGDAVALEGAVGCGVGVAVFTTYASHSRVNLTWVSAETTSFHFGSCFTMMSLSVNGLHANPAGTES